MGERTYNGFVDRKDPYTLYNAVPEDDPTAAPKTLKLKEPVQFEPEQEEMDRAAIHNDIINMKPDIPEANARSLLTVYLANRLHVDPLTANYDGVIKAYFGDESLPSAKTALQKIQGMKLQEQDYRRPGPEKTQEEKDLAKFAEAVYGPSVASPEELSVAEKLVRYNQVISDEGKRFAELAIVQGKPNMARFNTLPDSDKRVMQEYLQLLNPTIPNDFGKEAWDSIAGNSAKSLRSLRGASRAYLESGRIAQTIDRAFPPGADLTTPEAKQKLTELFWDTLPMTMPDGSYGGGTFFPTAPGKYTDLDPLQRTEVDMIPARYQHEREIRRLQKQERDLYAAVETQRDERGLVMSGLLGAIGMIPDWAAAAALGSVTGGYGSAAYFGLTYFGDMYERLYLDHGVDRTSALFIAGTTAVPYALAEELQLTQAFGKTGAVKAFAKSWSAGLVAVLKERGITTLAEVGEEGLQAVIESAALKAAKEFAAAEGITDADLIKNIADQTVAAFFSMPWMTGGGAVKQVYHGYQVRSDISAAPGGPARLAEAQARLEAAQEAAATGQISLADAMAAIPDAQPLPTEQNPEFLQYAQSTPEERKTMEKDWDKAKRREFQGLATIQDIIRSDYAEMYQRVLDEEALVSEDMTTEDVEENVERMMRFTEERSKTLAERIEPLKKYGKVIAQDNGDITLIGASGVPITFRERSDLNPAEAGRHIAKGNIVEVEPGGPIHHEAWHAMEQAGQIRESERAAMVSLAREMPDYEARKQKAIQLYAEHGTNLTDRQAESEVLGDMVQELRDTGDIAGLKDRTLFQRVLDFFRDLGNYFGWSEGGRMSVLERVAEGEPLSRPGRVEFDPIADLEKRGKAALQKIARARGIRSEGMSAQELRDALSTNVIDTTSDGGLEVRKGGSVNVVHYSLRTAEESAKMAEELIGMTGGLISDAQIKRYVKSLNAAANLVGMRADVLDFVPSQIFSALKDNSDPAYQHSVDFSTLCTRRIVLAATLGFIQTELKRPLNRAELVGLRRIMELNKVKVDCGACYVFSARMGIGTIIEKIWKGYTTKEGKVFPPTKIPHELFLTEEGLSKTIPEQYPEEYKEIARQLRAGTRSKAFQSRTEYRHEILKTFTPKMVREMNRACGLRWQSWSDFELVHLLDAMEAVFDMARIGLKGQAYTKQLEFAKVMAKTGIAINMSFIPKGSGLDANGDLVFDAEQSFPLEEAYKLREQYSNVGIISIGVNDAHIDKLLSDPRIDYVIPYHKSGMSAVFRDLIGMKGWEDYSKTEGWRDAKTGKKVDKVERLVFVSEHKGDRTEMERIAKERNVIAPFQQFREHPGYMKLITDRRIFGTDGKYYDQQAVKPVFDDKAIKVLVDNYTAPDTEPHMASVEQFMQELNAGTFASWAEANEAGNPEIGVPLREVAEKKKEEGVLHSYRSTADARYLELAKDPEGNKAELQKMVEGAAKAAGYVHPAFHGTKAKGFTVFDRRKAGSGVVGDRRGIGFYFSDSRTAARWFADEVLIEKTDDSELTESEFSVYGDGPYYLSGDMTGINAGPFRTEREAETAAIQLVDKWNSSEVGDTIFEEDNTMDVFLKYENPLTVDSMTEFRQSEKSAEAQGYDAIVADGVADGGEVSTVTVVFSPSQIKSADPVTYDDAGNVIPLSERFNPKTPDIRQSLKDPNRDANAIIALASMQQRGAVGPQTAQQMVRAMSLTLSPSELQSRATELRAQARLPLKQAKSNKDIIRALKTAQVRKVYREQATELFNDAFTAGRMREKAKQRVAAVKDITLARRKGLKDVGTAVADLSDLLFPERKITRPPQTKKQTPGAAPKAEPSFKHDLPNTDPREWEKIEARILSEIDAKLIAEGIKDPEGTAERTADYRATMVNILGQMAQELVPSRKLEAILGKLRDLSERVQFGTIREDAFALLREINKAAVRELRTDILDQLDDVLNLKTVKTDREKTSAQGEAIHQAVSGDIKQMLDFAKKAIKMTDPEVEAETDAIELSLRQNAHDPSDKDAERLRKEYQRRVANIRMMILEKFTNIKNVSSPIARAQEALDFALGLVKMGQDIIEDMVKKRDAEIADVTNAWIPAFLAASKRLTTTPKKSYIGALSLNETLQDSIRYLPVGPERDAAKAAVKKVQQMIVESNWDEQVVMDRMAQRLAEGAKSVYGWNWEVAMQKASRPMDSLKWASKNGRTPLSRANLMNMVAMLEDENYRRAATPDKEGNIQNPALATRMAQIDRMRDALTPQDLAMIPILRDVVSSELAELQKKVRKITGMDLALSGINYFPGSFEARLGGPAESYHGLDVFVNLIKKRVPHTRDLDETMNIFSKVHDHVRQTSKFLAWAETAQFVRGVFGQREFQTQMQDAFGKDYLKRFTEKWTDVVGEPPPGQSEDTLRMVRAATAITALAYNLPSSGRQFLSFPQLLTSRTYSGFLGTLKHINLDDVIMMAESPLVRGRLGSGPSALAAEAIRTGKDAGMTWLAMYIKYGMRVPAVGDAMLTSLFGAGMYRKFRSEMVLPEKEAHRKAMAMTADWIEQTQQSKFAKDLPDILRRDPTSFAGSVMMFATAPAQSWAKEYSALRDVWARKNDPEAWRDFAAAVIVNHIIQPAMMWAFTEGIDWLLTGDDEFEWEWSRLIISMATGPTAGILFVSAIIGDFLAATALGKRNLFGSGMIASSGVTNIAVDSGLLLHAIYDYATEGDDEKIGKSIRRLMGDIFAPMRLVNKVIENE